MYKHSYAGTRQPPERVARPVGVSTMSDALPVVVPAYTNAYATLFGYVAGLVGVVFFTNMLREWMYVDQKDFKSFLMTNIKRQNTNTRDIYYRILKSTKFLVITRQSALLMLSVLIIASYNFIGYMHTKDKADLISAIIPFVMYGIFQTTATHTSVANGSWTVFAETFGNALFTLATLLSVEIVRGTFSMPLYVPFVLVVLSMLSLFFATYFKNRHVRGVHKAITNSQMPFGAKMMQDENIDIHETSTETKWIKDNSTYIVYTIVDFFIIFIPLFIFGLIYSLKNHISHWEYSIIILFVPPLVYWVFQLVILFGEGWNTRAFFNLILSTMTVVTILMTLLYSTNVFGTENRFEIIIGIPLFLTYALFVISIVFKFANTVPFLSVSCIATDGDNNQCVLEKGSDAQGNVEMATVQHKLETKTPAV